MSIGSVLSGERRWWIEQGDVLDVLRAMPDESVHCVVTSIPYWGLRDYGTAKWEGGAADCDHQVRKPATVVKQVVSSGLEGGKATVGHQREGFKGTCPRCGAVRIDRQIGLEPTLTEYLARIVAVFEEVRRVLRRDGTCWLNTGDSYVSGQGGRQSNDGARPREARRMDAAPWNGNKPEAVTSKVVPTDLAPKQLVGQPWRVAFALQDAGWWLRSDIVWAKPNPMPESAGDRPTKAHEYLFLLTRSPRYHYDAQAIAEPVSGGAHARAAKMPDGWDTGPGAHGSIHRLGREKGRPAGVTPKSAEPSQGIKANQSFHAATSELVDVRNKRTVWTIPTEAYPDAHFATFPTALVEPCILAGCPKDGVVLDPFSGSGTTAMVALRHDRRALGCELNPAYVEMSKRRIVGDAPMFNQDGAA